MSRVESPSIASRIATNIRGIRTGWREEPGFRNQVVGFGAMLVTVLLLAPGPLWSALALSTFLVVLGLELINTALEALADLVHPEEHPRVGQLKDMSGGGVLLGSAALLLIGLLMIADSL